MTVAAARQRLAVRWAPLAFLSADGILNSEFSWDYPMAVIRTVPGLAEQVYQAVLDEICDGVLPPGTALVQEPLAERFGVSRQPVQQALLLLKADGLLEEVGRRGLHVAALDLTLMRHHYEIRGALDELAAGSAARRAKADSRVAQEARSRGAALVEAGERAVTTGATREQIRADEAFHNFLYELSGNPLLARTVEVHWRFLRRVMGDVLRHAESPRSIWQQHAQILDAVAAGDPSQAQRHAREHLHVAADRLATALSSSPSAVPGAAG